MGSRATANEKAKAAEFCASVREERGNIEFICYEEGSPRTLDPTLSAFAKHLPVDDSVGGGQSAGVRAAEAGGDDAAVQGVETSAYGLSIKGGEIGIEALASGRLPRSLLNTEAVVLVDSGFHIFLWVGTGTAFPLRVSAFTFAQAYVTRFKRPPILPLTRFAEGQESDKFWRLFSKPQGYRIDAKPEPERVHPMMRAKPKPRLHAAKQPHEAKLTTTAPAAKLPSPGMGTGGGTGVALGHGEVGVVAVGGGGVTVPRLATSSAATAAQEALGATQPAVRDEDDEDEDDENATLTSQDIPTAEKLKFNDGVCYPIVSDAWG